MGLQNQIEVIMLLRKSANKTDKDYKMKKVRTGTDLSLKLFEYASELASQGALETAITYLGDQKEENEFPLITEMRERVFGAIGKNQIFKMSGKSSKSSSKKFSPIPIEQLLQNTKS